MVDLSTMNARQTSTTNKLHRYFPLTSSFIEIYKKNTSVIHELAIDSLMNLNDIDNNNFPEIFFKNLTDQITLFECYMVIIFHYFLFNIDILYRLSTIRS